MFKQINLPQSTQKDDGFSMYHLDEETCKLLLEEGDKALQFTFPEPNSGFAVALLTDKGTVITGASYKSDTHNTTMHSEAVALARAAQQGETRIVAITGPNCHNCKQLVWESSIRSKIDTIVIIQEEGNIKQIPISELMPYAWPDKNLNK